MLCLQVITAGESDHTVQQSKDRHLVRLLEQKRVSFGAEAQYECHSFWHEEHFSSQRHAATSKALGAVAFAVAYFSVVAKQRSMASCDMP